MNDQEYSTYSNVLKKGFSNCKEYVEDKLEILDTASSKLKDSFSVDYILSYCLSKNRFKNLTFDEKQNFLKELFEIYFTYSKNLLIYFDIYSQKCITENTSQMVNFLSKIPNSSKHLELIGYSYNDNTKEWKYSMKKLTSERRDILISLTLCCCLAYNFLQQPLKFLSVSIFKERQKSFKKLLDGKTCEYCNFELDKTLEMCSVCDQRIDAMQFFKDWIITFSTAATENDSHEEGNNIMKGIRSINENKGYHSLPTNFPEKWSCYACTYESPMTSLTCDACFTNREKNTIVNGDSNILLKDQKMWTCSYCSFVNELSQSLCHMCSNKRETKKYIDTLEDDRKQRIGSNIFSEKEENSGEIPKLKENYSSLDYKPMREDRQTWTCSQCTLKNEVSKSTCSACSNKDDRRPSMDEKKEEDEENENNFHNTNESTKLWIGEPEKMQTNQGNIFTYILGILEYVCTSIKNWF